MSALIQDLRFLGRLARRAPGFYFLVVLTLALGIGANLAVFAVANGVLLSPLPYQDPDQLVAIWESNIEEGKQRERVAPPNFGDYMEVFQDAAAWWHFDVNLSDATGADPLRVSTVECTANLFSVLGVGPSLGAGFAADSDQLYSAELAAVISDRLWKSRYAADPSIIGQQITLNGNAYTITGVMAAGFAFPAGDVDIWQRQSWPLTRRTRYAHFMEAVGRLPPRTTIAEVQARLTTISERLALEYPASNTDWRARLVPLHAEIVGDYRPALLVLLGAVGLLILLAAVNVANLLLTRARRRQLEMAIRLALGASPGRMLRLTLTEALALGIAAASVGGFLATVTVHLLVTNRPVPIPRLSEVDIGGEVFIFGALVTLIATAISTTLPAFRLISTGSQALLQEQRAADRRFARRLLVILETALAMTLLIGAGLMIRSVRGLLGIDPGYIPDQTVTATLELPATVYPEWTDVSQLYHHLLESLKSHPNVASAGAASFLPLKPGWIVPYSVPDRPAHHDGETLRAQYVTASYGYIETLHIPLLAGRTFTSHDDANSPPAIVINEEMARRTWSNAQSAVGKHVKTGTSGFGPLGRSLVTSDDVYEVIGVVANTLNNGLESTADPVIYFTLRQFPYRTMAIVIRGDVRPGLLLPELREALNQIDPNLPLAMGKPLTDLINDETARPRFVMLLLMGFAILALVLAAIGVYGVLSYAVSERRQEIAIRSSLGATPNDIRIHVLREGFILAIMGVILGFFLSLGLSRFMASLLFEVSFADPQTFLAATLFIAGVSLSASFMPANRAANAHASSNNLRVE